MAFHNLSKKSRGMGRQSIIKEAADPLPQKKTRRFLRSLFVRKKINLAPTIPSDILHLGYRSANYQFITWSRKNLHCYKCLKTPQMKSECHKRRAERAGKALQRLYFRSLPRLMFQDEKDFCLQVPTNCEINKFISMMPRNMCNWNAGTAKETNFRKRLWFLL